MLPGGSASKNFVLVEQIKTINDLVSEIENSKSLFWRHRVHPTSFFLGWPLRTLLITINDGHFWKIKNKNESV